MKLISAFIIICLTLTLCYLIGLVQFLIDYEVDQCEMTYMFEYPQFVKITNEIDKKYPKYELHAYSEGRFTNNARNMDFKGVPVLFIPGNAGSHKQVRSLSSVALRKALNSRTPFHFNYFTVNLNNEYSGLSGVVLNDQMDYVNNSIYRILDLYKGNKQKPSSVVLVGHSMGGVIAERIISSLNDDSTLIPIVISLSAPLKRPPLILDRQMERFYKNLKPKVPKKTTFVSLTGGFSDILITPSITNLTDNAIIKAVTTNIPKSWVEANHVQILWCKQTILAINRALFDSVDLKTKQISNDADYRKSVFEHHLIHNSGIKIRQAKSYSDVFKIDGQGLWTEITNKQYTVSMMQGVNRQQWYLVPITDNYLLNVLAVNLEVTDWIFICQAIEKGNEKTCSDGIHLSQKSEIAPSMKYKRRTIQLDFRKIKSTYPDMTHILIRVLPTDEPVVIHVDSFVPSKRSINVDVPKLWSFKRQQILGRSQKNVLHYQLQLPDLYHVWQSYYLYVEPIKCTHAEHHAVAQLRVPWANDNINQYFTESKNLPLHIRLHSSKPSHLKDQTAIVILTLDASCDYKISIKSSLLGTLSQLARHYSSLLIVNVAAVLLMTFRTQLKNFSSGSFQLFFVAMSEGLKPYYVLTSAKLLAHFFSFPFFTKWLPIPDWNILKEDNLDFLVLPLLLYTCSVGIVYILAIVFSVSVVMLESSVNKFTLKFLAKTIKFPYTWTDYLMSALHKLPFAVAAILVVVTMTGCGALALALGAIFYFLKLTQMSQDFIEDVLWYFVRNFAKKLKKAMAAKFSKNKTKSDKKIGIKEIKDVKTNNVVKEIKDTEDNKETTVKSVEAENGIDMAGPSHKDDSLTEDSEDKTEDKANQIVQTETENQIEEVHTNETETEGPKEETSQPKPFTAHNAIFFHSSIFFIWTMITLLNVPIMLTWAHNFKYKNIMSPDPSFVPGLALSICAFPLWQLEFPNKRKWDKELSKFIIVVVVIALIFAPISLYRLNYLLTIVIVIVVLQQLFAPSSEVEELDDNEDKHLEDRYDKVKTKLD